VRWLTRRFAPQQRPVVGVAKPDDAIDTNGDALHTLGVNEYPVCTSYILEYPSVLFMPKDGMTPGHTGISKHDVGRRIPA
jgi:hypothetical protein